MFILKAKMLFRIILYIIGLNVLALGTTLFACGKLGVSSLVSVPQTLSFILNTTLLAILCTALGIFMMVKASFVLIPADGFVNVISDKFNKPFGQMKFCFDASMIVITIILGLVFLHHITSIGIGTVLAVLFVGQLINLFNYIVDKTKKT